MIEDRNKTDLTKSITRAVISYLDDRGCKPIETEVPVEPGWIADVATVITPTRTELADLKLIKRAPRWNDPTRSEWLKQSKELLQLMTILVEVKSSKSDLCNDRKWKVAPPTNLAYLAIPTDLLLLAHAEVNPGWGILVHGTDYVRIDRAPVIRTVTTEQQLAVVHEIALRRDHDTRHERLRDLQKRFRNDQNEYISRTRITSALWAMKAVVRGEYGSAKDCLERHGITSVPAGLMEGIEKLYAVAKPEEAAHG